MVHLYTYTIMKIFICVSLFVLPIFAFHERWVLQKKNVCFGAKRSQFGTFEVQSTGLLRAIKLVHTKGQVTCRHGHGHSNWGCGGKKISTVVTTITNKILSPGNVASSGWVTLPKYTSESRVIVLDNPAYEAKVKEGQTLRLWYGEDLKDWHDGDNSGTSCADVYADIEQDKWSLQRKNVCFGAKKNNFGTFHMNHTGTLHSIKLVHRYGYVSCYCGLFINTKTNFGCGHHDLATIITDQRNEVVFPSNMGSNGLYKLPPYKPTSKELVLDNPTFNDYQVKKGQEMRIWYGEDLKDHWEHDNCGTSCVDVYADMTMKFRCTGEDDGCCTAETPCNKGEGDCDSDNECAGDLKCGDSNCRWGDKDDCCY